MPKEVVLTALGNRIEYATTDGKGLITGKREDITEQSISAVYAHFQKEFNSKNKDGKAYGVKYEDGSRLMYIAPDVEFVWKDDNQSNQKED